MDVPQQWEGQAAQGHQQPAEGTDKKVSFSSGGVVPQRTHDELTAPHADAHQEVDGGVHVDVLKVEADHAEKMTKGPHGVQVIVDPQRQREHLRRAKRPVW